MIKDQNPKIQQVQIAEIDIDADNRLRPVSEAGVESMIASIEEIGVIKDAIHLRRKRRAKGDSLVLIAGGHRLEAAKRLGWEEIPARIWTDITDAAAKFMEIDDNLAGKALDPLDQAEFLAERKRVYEGQHPETARGLAGAKARWDATANLAIASFVQATAEATGMSERSIRRRAMVGEKLTKAEIGALRAAENRIKAGDLEALAKISEPQLRSDIVERLATGASGSVAEARAELDPGTRKEQRNPDDVALQKLTEAWTRAPMKVKRIFVQECYELLSDILSDEFERRDM